MSNLSPIIWPLDRQERLLADVTLGARVFRDVLSGKQRMGRDFTAMTALDSLTRANTRRDPKEETWVASPAVLHWTAEGLLSVIGALQGRGGALCVVEPEMRIGPKATTAELQAAVAAFHAAKKREAAEKRGKLGGEISGERREAEARAKMAPHLDLWRFADPEKYPTHLLLRLMGVSFNTAKKHAGPRKNAIRKPSKRGPKK